MNLNSNCTALINPNVNNEFQQPLPAPIIPPRPVAYIYSSELTKLCNAIERTPGRQIAIHTLVHAYGLLQKVSVRKPKRAPKGQLEQFHSKDYIAFLERLSNTTTSVLEKQQLLATHAAEFGLTHDCFPHENLFNYISLVAGGTLEAVNFLTTVTSATKPPETFQPLFPKTEFTTIKRARSDPSIHPESSNSHRTIFASLAQNHKIITDTAVASTARNDGSMDVGSAEQGLNGTKNSTENAGTRGIAGCAQLPLRAGCSSLQAQDSKPGFAPSCLPVCQTDTNTLLHKFYRAPVAINWAGGWHHARAAAAAGYCYVNDCILAIMALLDAGNKRVLYVDLDAHHGDAVQDAFDYTHKVMCVSFHLHDPGFYPGTGASDECGSGKGYGYTLNIPLKQGLSNDQWLHINDSIFPSIRANFNPDVVVVQCGADGLSQDPTKAFNLTPDALIHTLKIILSWNIPTLLLGGGGYHKQTTAKCWTRLTSVCAEAHPLPEDIPEHALFTQYGPDYTLNVDESRIPNENSEAFIDELIENVLSMLEDVGSDV